MTRRRRKTPDALLRELARVLASDLDAGAKVELARRCVLVLVEVRELERLGRACGATVGAWAGGLGR